MIKGKRRRGGCGGLTSTSGPLVSSLVEPSSSCENKISRYLERPSILRRQRIKMLEQKKYHYLKGKRITVMGLGLNQGGLGTVRFLIQVGAKVLVTDLKSKKDLSFSLEQLKGLPVTHVLGRHRDKDFIDTDLVIKNPGVPRNSRYLKIAKKNKVPIETDISIFLRHCSSQNIVAIAGTKGKGTVASLIYHLFKVAKEDVVIAGNIGVSVFDILPRIKPRTMVILEISSWQLEGLRERRFAPRIAVLTNILPDHLDRYRTFNNYERAEKLIFKYQNQGNFLISSADNELTFKAGKEAKSQIFWFSEKKKINQGCFLKNDKIVWQADGQEKTIIKISEIPLLGRHNVLNVLAACSVAMICELQEETVNKAIQSFKNLPHRLEFIRELEGVRFYNDSTATTPDACLAAIHSFNQPIILILGGKDKKMSFEKLIKEIAKNKKVKKIILLEHLAYDASVKMLEAIKKYQIEKRVIFTHNIKRAIKSGWENAVRGDIILLSPAAASFGMFQNEFDRGRRFVEFVKKINDQ